jgi:sugar transferase (PEP-CTERM/EpsH1 system associated)
MKDILYLTHRIPYPPNKGDKIRSYHILKYLSKYFRVHLGSFVDDPSDRQYIGTVAALCASSCFVNRSPSKGRLLGLAGLISKEALSVTYYRDSQLARWVKQLLTNNTIHHALAFSGPMAQYLTIPQAKSLHKLIDFVDVDSEKWHQYATLERSPFSALYRREARRLLNYEREVAQQFNSAIFVSAAEATLFCIRVPTASNTSFFSNGVDADYFSPQRTYCNPYPNNAPVVVFVGAMDYWPNVEAAQWFAQRVLPALRVQFPGTSLSIVGARPSSRAMALKRLPGVAVVGAVPDVRPYLAHAALALAPLHIGRGIQNKVLEAMSMQKIVLASPAALEGICAVPGKEVLLARDESEFIHMSMHVLTGGAAANLGFSARQRILQDYNWHENLTQLSTLFGLPS